MTELNERQKKFIGAVLARMTDGNKCMLEAILKSYAINEGIVAHARPTQAGARQLPAENRSVPDYPALRRAMMFEKDCWDRDLNRFYQNCELIQYYLANYGIRDFNQITGSDEFKKAVEFGKTLDKMRVNPLKKEDARRRNMTECLERFRNGDDRVLVEGIMSDFYESETVTIGVIPMFESREDNLGPFKNAMAGVVNFLRRHGFYPWGKFLKENRMLLARANRFDQTEYPEEADVPSAKMVADVREAYSAGSAES